MPFTILIPISENAVASAVQHKDAVAFELKANLLWRLIHGNHIFEHIILPFDIIPGIVNLFIHYQ